MRCTWEGTIHPGPLAFNSSVQLYHCEGLGPHEENELGLPTFEPAAAWFAGGDALAVGTTFRGTDGSNGHAVVLSDEDWQQSTPFSADGPALASFLDCTFVPGAPGPPTLKEIHFEAGSFQPPPGTATDFAVTSPVREGRVKTETYTGTTGHLVLRATSPSLVPATFIPAWNGTVHLGSPSFLRIRGLVPASGVLAKNVSLSELGPGIEHAALFEQAFFVDLGTLAIQSGPPVALHLLDAAF